MGLLKWVVEKAVIYGIVFAFFYFISSALNVIPQPLKDFIAWLSQNFVIICFTICVIVVCYTVVRLSSGGGNEE